MIVSQPIEAEEEVQLPFFQKLFPPHYNRQTPQTNPIFSISTEKLENLKKIYFWKFKTLRKLT